MEWVGPTAVHPYTIDASQQGVGPRPAHRKTQPMEKTGRYEHAVTVYDLDDILAQVASPSAEEPPSMVYCDEEGLCFFDEGPNPYLAAMVGLMNEQGQQGWSLVQFVPRRQELICFWKRKLLED